MPAVLRNDWSRAEVLALLDLPFPELMARAGAVHREHFDPREVQVSTLLSIKTGGCPEDCAYCPQAARYDTGLKAHKLLSLDEVVEKASAALNAAGVAGPAPDALGTDYNGDGRGIGFNVPSLLGLGVSPPYYHNGACESLACVVGNLKHRTQNGRRADGLPNSRDRTLVVKFLQSIDARTRP